MFWVISLVWARAAGHLKTHAPAESKGVNMFLENWDDVSAKQRLYYVSADIGTPPQSVSLLLDTAYAYLRVDGEDCMDCITRKRFRKGSSSTFSADKEVTFSGAPAVIGKDQVSLGNLIVRNQTLAVLQSNSSKDYRGFDGLLVTFTQGLAFEHPDRGDLNLLETLMQQKVIDTPIFALHLSNNPKEIEKSVISFGSYNLSKYSLSTSFEHVPVDLTKGTWAFDITDPRINYRFITKETRTAILSSAVGKMVIPEDVYNATQRYICSRVRCEFDPEPFWNCSKQRRSVLGSMTFNLNGMKVLLTSYELTYRFGKQGLCRFNFRTEKGVDGWLLGARFMQKYYLLFNAQNSSVGFALNRHDYEAPEESQFWMVFWTCVGVIVILVAITVTGWIVTRKYLKSD